MLIKSNRYVILLFACLSAQVYATPLAHLCEAASSLCTWPVNFGTQTIKTISAPKTVILSNTGNTPLTVTNMEIAGEFSLGETYACYNKGSSSCAKPPLPCTTIPAGAGCTFNVWYAPVSDPGANQSLLFSAIGALKFTTDAAKPEVSIALVGTTDTRGCSALPAPSKLFADTTVGNNSTTVDIIIPATTTERSLDIYTTGDFTQTNNCGNTLAANATCPVTLTFSPSVTGTRYGQLYYNRNARSCGLADYTLEGKATGTNSGPASATTPVNPVAPTKGDDGGGTGDTTTNIKGCTMGKSGSFDPVLALLVLFSALSLYRKRKNK
jgi:hypothetical protein